MTFNYKGKQHTVDMLFVLSLFAVFAITALLLIFSGTRVYESITEGMQSSFSSRTAISYIKKQVDQNNSVSAVSVAEVEGQTALRLVEEDSGEYFSRYIYLHDGYLCELFTKVDITPRLNSGQPLLELKAFALERDGNLFTFTVTDHTDNVLSATLSTV